MRGNGRIHCIPSNIARNGLLSRISTTTGEKTSSSSDVIWQGSEHSSADAPESFREGPLLFPESSAGDLVALDLNGDRITDLVLVHWLSDRMAVYFGIGQCAFSEQVSLTLPAEPGRISVTAVQKRQVLRVPCDASRSGRRGAYRREPRGRILRPRYDHRSPDIPMR